MVNNAKIAAHLWATKGRESQTGDAVRNLRDELKKVVGKKGKGPDLIETLSLKGYRLSLAAGEVEIVP